MKRFVLACSLALAVSGAFAQTSAVGQVTGSTPNLVQRTVLDEDCSSAVVRAPAPRDPAERGRHLAGGAAAGLVLGAALSHGMAPGAAWASSLLGMVGGAWAGHGLYEYRVATRERPTWAFADQPEQVPASTGAPGDAAQLKSLMTTRKEVRTCRQRERAIEVQDGFMLFLRVDGADYAVPYGEELAPGTKVRVSYDAGTDALSLAPL